MADKKISELTGNTAPESTDIAPVTRANGSATNKVTLGLIAQLFSDSTDIANAVRITNIVSISQTNYNSLSSYSATTLYIIE